MSFLYITEHGCSIGVDGGKLVIKHKDNTIDSVPRDTLDGISIFGKSYMTAQCIQACLEAGINVSHFNSSGKYLGMTSGAGSANAERIKKQILLSEEEHFSIEFSKNIIHAKINNQLVVAKRYLRDKEMAKEKLFYLRHSRRKILRTATIGGVRGYEGLAARNYFDIIGCFIEEPFKFNGRKRRPAADPFNAMINFGYSILTKEIVGELENRSLYPYIGFLHKNHDRMPALACDMIEEWRAPIVDSTVLSLIQGHEIDRDMFNNDEGFCIINYDAIKILLHKLEEKMYTEMKYLSYIDKPLTFRQAIWHQADRLAKAIDSQNSEIYLPILIR